MILSARTERVLVAAIFTLLLLGQGCNLSGRSSSVNSSPTAGLLAASKAQQSITLAPQIVPTLPPPAEPAATEVSTYQIYGAPGALTPGWLRSVWTQGLRCPESGGTTPYVTVGGAMALHADMRCDAWNAVTLEQRTPDWTTTEIAPAAFTHVSFDLNPGAAPGAVLVLELSLDNGSSGVAIKNYVSSFAANVWTHVRIPLKALNDQELPYFRIVFFNASPSAGPNFYLNNVRLEKDASVPAPAPLPSAAVSADVSISINTALGRTPISPHIFGVNQTSSLPEAPFVRLGGNRYTSYNWKNNFSNGGIDYCDSSNASICNHNDDYLSSSTVSGEAVRSRVTAAHLRKASALVTVPMVDYVAADGQGFVTQVASSSNIRFSQNLASKSAGTCAAAGGCVYQDEFVSFVERTFAADRAAGAQTFYSLDNEPGLWRETHPLIHPTTTSYAEMSQRSIRYASMIKSLAPASAMVFGAVAYGYNEYVTLQGAPDGAGRDYLSFFLAEMKKAEATAGRRLVDVLDLHYYTEARSSTGVQVAGENSANPTQAVIDARVQSPRSLWDPNYKENSWIVNDYLKAPINLLPNLRAKIAGNYPGTKLAFTEYNYGGGAHISGAIAQADVLGIYAREGVFAANYWELKDKNVFTYAAFKMYLNYDGLGGKTGDTMVQTAASDLTRTSAYATVAGTNNSKVVVVVINKTTSIVPANIQLTNSLPLTTASVYQLTAASATPQAAGTLPVSGNAFIYQMPPLSVSTLVIH